eukprot:TRINITY_DN3386_c0_g3_i1.p1 TRINITY_DN3386_c0_g3~~TRINITY_DN3386_c0_g3_i1.p1  ORF type:complete len:211 (+),score=36.75 TRINITY_DN3386_c0_g3_i1:817-1449(+)
MPPSPTSSSSYPPGYPPSSIGLDNQTSSSYPPGYTSNNPPPAPPLGRSSGYSSSSSYPVGYPPASSDNSISSGRSSGYSVPPVSPESSYPVGYPPPLGNLTAPGYPSPSPIQPIQYSIMTSPPAHVLLPSSAIPNQSYSVIPTPAPAPTPPTLSHTHSTPTPTPTLTPPSAFPYAAYQSQSHPHIVARTSSLQARTSSASSPYGQPPSGY